MIETTTTASSAPRGKSADPKLTDVDMAALQVALVRIEPQVNREDWLLFKHVLETLAWVFRLLQAQRTTLARLRSLFKLKPSEGLDALRNKEKQDPPAPPQCAEPGAVPPPEATTTTAEPQAGATPQPRPKKPRAKGHGRIPVSSYATATHIPVTHQSLAAGGACPGCARGKLCDLEAPACLLRITGQPVLTARSWDCQRLRCSACGDVYTAQAPQEAQGPKFDETAVSMLALCRYRVGLPHHRLARLQAHLQTPIPSSTQWDVLNQAAPLFLPVLEALRRVAAQGQVIHDDDTYVRVLAFMGKRRAALLAHGFLPTPERTGLFTTAMLALTAVGIVVLFASGRKYAAENLADLLQARAPTQESPALMCDGLESRNVPKEPKVVVANCLVHARRGIVEQFDNFPAECTHILEKLGLVFKTDAQCKQQGLDDQARLLAHQRDSAPVLQALHQWLLTAMSTKQVEPNSGLGKAYNYILKRWDKLTLFLRRPGAPLDNNICERALKMAIAHRRNSLFYKTQHGAAVGDLFMSLIYTAELHHENPFIYLTELQRYAKAVAADPDQWLPWTYRATLARLAAQQPAARAPPPRPNPPPSPAQPAPASSALTH